MKKNHISELLTGNTDNEMLSELQSMLDEELSKDENERNYDTIAEITAAIAEISGAALSDAESEKRAENIITELHAAEKRRNITRLWKWASAACACLVVGIALNFYTMSAFGENIFAAIVDFTNSGFSLDFANFTDEPNEGELTITTAPASSQTDPGTVTTLSAPAVIALTTAPDDPTDNGSSTPAVTTSIVEPQDSTTLANLGDIITQNIGDELDELYVPDKKLFINNYEFSRDVTDISTDYYFTFTSNIDQLDIIIENYQSREEMPSQLIPADEESYSTIYTEAGTAFIFKESSHVTAMFVNGSTVYTVVGHGMSQIQVEKIMQSFCRYTK